jgi:hypothetical protein
LRDTPYPQVKEEVAGYFLKNNGKEIGYEELIGKLRLDPLTSSTRVSPSYFRCHDL